MKNYRKAEPGGESLNQIAVVNLRFLHGLVFLLCWLVLSAASAADIPVNSHKKIFSFGSEQLSLPSDVALLNNKIYVVDGSHHRIAVFDMDGQFLFAFGSKGKKAGQLYYPVGISAGSDQRIYVADSGNHRIQIFDKQGKFIAKFDVRFKGKKVRPIDVILHNKNHRLYVSANKSHNILVYSRKGKLLDSWGGNGIAEAEFRYPATIEQMKDGRIAIIDVLNSRAQVFNPDGKLSLIVGQWGALPGRVVRPKGIAIDKHNTLYISDSYMGVVQSYTDEGRFTGVLGQGNRPDKLTTPVGMAAYKQRLYVVEMRANRVSVYQLAR